jgi:hypothetical protein
MNSAHFLKQSNKSNMLACVNNSSMLWKVPDGRFLMVTLSPDIILESRQEDISRDA